MKYFALLITAFACLCGELPGQTDSGKAGGNYVMGPGDVISVRVLDIEEFSPPNLGPIRVDNQGDIRLPVVGQIHAEGLTTGQLEDQVRKALSAIMNAPQVTVTVTEFGSSPVSILGAVRNPGVHQVSGRKTLFEVLSLAGGFNSDAGNVIVITRRADAGPLPLSGSEVDTSGRFLIARLKVRAVMEAKDPAANINVLPYDVITVPKADLVYVIGAVKKSGGFVLNEKDQVSALQALSMAEGLDNLAAASGARILRQDEVGTARTEIPVNLRSMLRGNAPDFLLHANDILFVPDSKAKTFSLRALEAAIQMGTGVVIWRQ